MLDREINPNEASSFKNQELDTEIFGEDSDVNQNLKNKVRFNLYKACFQQLQFSFIKVSRLAEFLQLGEYERDLMKDNTKQSFDIFSKYCTKVMKQRREDIMNEQKYAVGDIEATDTNLFIPQETNERLNDSAE